MRINWKEINMKQVGEKLYRVRKSKELNQKQFIDGCGINFRQYSKYETGKNKPKANEENFLKLLTKHNIDFEWLLYEHEERPTNAVSACIEVKTNNGNAKIIFQDKPYEFLQKAVNAVSIP